MLNFEENFNINELIFFKCSLIVEVHSLKIINEIVSTCDFVFNIHVQLSIE